MTTGLVAGCGRGAPATVGESTATGASAPIGPSECVGTLSGPDTHQYRQVNGVDPNQLSLDVYRHPGSSLCPVLVWVHGGGWSRGDKQGNAIDTKVQWAGEHGMALVSVNYRLADGSGVVWPGNGQDVAAAFAWVRAHAEELGIDAAKMVLAGHSAGAQLATIVSTSPTLLAGAGLSPIDIACTISADTAAYDLTAPQPLVQPLIKAAFGTDPAVLSDASPLHQVRSHPMSSTDTLVLTRGRRPRVGSAEQYAAAIRGAGGSAQVLDVSPYSHAQVNARFGAPGETVETPTIETFLRTCLR